MQNNHMENFPDSHNSLAPTLATINGVTSALLPVDNRGASYGHGLFETMLYHSSSIPLWQRHSDRLIADAAVLGITVSEQLLLENLTAITELLRQQSIENGVIKIIVTAGSGGRGYASPETMLPLVICQYWPLPENLVGDRQTGVKLRQCHYRLPANPLLAGIKHLNRLDQVMARREWSNESTGAYFDGLMYDQDNQLIETTSANIFVKTANGWVTPLLDRAGVRGVMRGLLLDQLYQQAGLSVFESRVGWEQLASAEEVFICSSIRGLIPVTAIDQLGQWAIGPETRQLQTALADYCSGYPC